ncbi:Ser/Thr protein phosphatase superfamily protein [Mycena epipterygia]|nr:Ser/Thr protein phosphatase superfamily protein [Mycena epipterygia]
MSSPRIQFMSDLHLEVRRWDANGGTGNYYAFDFPATADTLALLGDIGNTCDERLYDWLSVQLIRFKLVLFLAGNHEPYKSTLEASIADLTSFAAESEAAAASSPPEKPLGRFVFLNRTRLDISPTLTVLGCTLWSHLDPENIGYLRLGLNDFHRIDGFDTDAYEVCYKEDLAWLERTVAQMAEREPGRRVVVMTHHAPTVADTSDPVHVGGPSNSAFATEVLARVCKGSAVAAWAFGHTHWNCDFERAGVRVVANQRGYGDGEDGFDPSRVLEILP